MGMKGISIQDKLMYGIIYGLSNETGYCWASNKYLGVLIERDERTVRRIVTKLCDAGLLAREENRGSRDPERTRRLSPLVRAEDIHDFPPQPPLDELYIKSEELGREDNFVLSDRTDRTKLSTNNNINLYNLNNNNIGTLGTLDNNGDIEENDNSILDTKAHRLQEPLYSGNKEPSRTKRAKRVNEPKEHNKKEYLSEMKQEELERIAKMYNVDMERVEWERQKAVRWLELKGTHKSDYRRFFENWIQRLVDQAHERGTPLPEFKKKVRGPGIPAEIQERLNNIDWSKTEEEEW